MPTSRAPGRRQRDLIVTHETDNPRLAGDCERSNLLLLVDDDIRQSAQAMRGIDRFLAEVTAALSNENLTADELRRVSNDPRVGACIETMTEAVATLQRRLGALSTRF